MKFFWCLAGLLVVVSNAGCDEEDSNNQVIPGGANCVDGQTEDTIEGECVYDGVCVESGMRLRTWKLCVQENWERRTASVACNRETDGISVTKRAYVRAVNAPTGRWNPANKGTEGMKWPESVIMRIRVHKAVPRSAHGKNAWLMSGSTEKMSSSVKS